MDFGLGAMIWNFLKSTLESKIDTIDSNVDDINTNIDQSLSTTESNIRGVDNDTLKTLSDQIDTTESKIDTIDSNVDTINSNIDQSLSTTESNIRGTDNDTLKTLSDQLDSVSTSSFIVKGTCDSGMSASTTTIVSSDLKNYGDDYFNDKWWLQVVKNDNSVGNAPDGEYRQVIDYESSTGTFTTLPFSANVEENDEIAVIHESQYLATLADGRSFKTTDNTIIKKITAGENISVGDFLALNEADGKVYKDVGEELEWGDESVFNSAHTSYISAVYDSVNDKIVIAYRDEGNSNYGTAVVGTVSGNSISFGTPVVFNSATTFPILTIYDSNSGKIVIVYRDYDNSSYGIAVVGTVSGNGISFGTPVVFNSATTNHISVAYDSANGKIVIAYQDGGNSNYGTAIVGTVSGDNISFGMPVIFNSADTSHTSATYDSNSSKIVVAYRDGGNSNYGTAIVGTVAGNSILFGTPVVFESASTYNNSIAYDSNSGKIVVAYKDNDNSSYGTAVVGTVAGNSISFGTPIVFNSATTEWISATYDSGNGKVIIAYQDAGNFNYGTAIAGTVSGDIILFGTPIVFNSASTGDISVICTLLNGKVIIAYKDGGNSNYGTAITNILTYWIGIAQNSGFTGDDIYVRLLIKNDIDNSLDNRIVNARYYNDSAIATSSREVLITKNYYDQFDTTESNLDRINSNVNVINAKVDQSLSTTESNIRGTDNDTLKTLSDQIDTVDSVVDTINTKVDTIDSNVDTINSNIDQSLSTTESNIRGVDNDTLKTLSDQLDTIDANVDTVNANVDQSLSATEANIRGADSDDLKTLSDQLDVVEAAVANSGGGQKRTILRPFPEGFTELISYDYPMSVCMVTDTIGVVCFAISTETIRIIAFRVYGAYIKLGTFRNQSFRGYDALIVRKLADSKFLIVGTRYGYSANAVCGTVDENLQLSFGAIYDIYSPAGQVVAMDVLEEDKALVAYASWTGTRYLYCRILTVSGTTISGGSPVSLVSDPTLTLTNVDVVAMSSQTAVVMGRFSNASSGTVHWLTIDGTSITEAYQASDAFTCVGGKLLKLNDTSFMTIGQEPSTYTFKYASWTNIGGVLYSKVGTLWTFSGVYPDVHRLSRLSDDLAFLCFSTPNAHILPIHLLSNEQISLGKLVAPFPRNAGGEVFDVALVSENKVVAAVYDPAESSMGLYLFQWLTEEEAGGRCPVGWTITSDGGRLVSDGTPEVTDVSSSSSANTFGNWTLVVAPELGSWLTKVCVRGEPSVADIDKHIKWQLARGRAGSEEILAQVSYTRYDATDAQTKIFELSEPLFIGPQERVSMRIADNLNSAKTYKVSCVFRVNI